MRKEIASFSEDEGESKDEGIGGSNSFSGGYGRILDSGLGFLGPSFYHYGENVDYVQWSREYSKLKFDVMVTFHHACLNAEMLSLRSEEYSLLEPCEVLTKEEWIF